MKVSRVHGTLSFGPSRALPVTLRLMSALTSFFLQSALEAWHMTVLAAPFLLLGLVMAGFVHVLLPSRVVQRHLGRPGMRGAATAAAVGVPLPVCSCGVLPLAVEMKRKKASDAASLSFLTTTPESGVDSILFSWALLGPLMAVARPVAAFATAMLGALWLTAFPTGPKGVGSVPGTRTSNTADSVPGTDSGDDSAAVLAETAHALSGCGAEPDACCCEALPLDEAEADGAQGDAEPETASAEGVWARSATALRYGFGELLDDIAFWLVLGLVLAGFLSVALPDDLAALGLGDGLWPMLAMLGIGIPLYICASASTPVAAALLAKGLSPGAALVFLLAGPATNAASLVVLGRTFGGRFVRVYVTSVAVGSLACGLLFDALLAAFGWTLALPAAASMHEHAAAWELVAAGLLVVLLGASFLRGSLRRGWTEFASGARALGRLTLARLGFV